MKLFEYQYMFKCSSKGDIYPVTRWCESFKEVSILPECVIILSKYDKYISINQTYNKSRSLLMVLRVKLYVLKRKLRIKQG